MEPDDGDGVARAGEPGAEPRYVTTTDYYSAALRMTEPFGADGPEAEAHPEAAGDAVEPDARPQVQALAAAIGPPVLPRRIDPDRADHE